MGDNFSGGGGSGGGSGTVTNIATDATLTGGPITITGTLGIASSAALPGSPTTTTQSEGDNSTKIATTAFVETAVTTLDLASGDIFVGNASNVATDVTMSGDATMANTGAITIAAGAVTGGKIASNVALAGSPTTTTQSAADNSTKISTTAFVTTAVNNAIAGVNPAVAVAAATAAVLPNTPTYSNGAAGIGATLTSSTQSVLVVDGYTPLLNDRILVKNQATAANNGIYSVTQLGVGGVLPWIMTRVLDFDQPSDMNNTGAIPVVNGTANAATSWVLTATVNTVGTDAVTFTQFSLNPTTILSNTLTSGNIFVGNGSNVATGVALSGDATLTNAGVISVTGNSGAYARTGIIKPAITVNQNDWNPTGLATTGVIRITNTTSYLPMEITGLQGGTEGRILDIENAGASTYPVRLTASSASSSAANRFGFIDNIMILPGETVRIIYDADASLWRAPLYDFFAVSQNWGSGQDGNVSIPGALNLTTNKYYTNLVLSNAAALNPSGYAIYCKETLDISAAPANAIRISPVNGNAGAASGTAGAAPSAGTSAWLGTGLTGAAGGAGSSTNGVAGGNGGATTGTQGGGSSAGGTAGTGSGGTAGGGGTSSGATGYTIGKYTDQIANVRVTALNGGGNGAGGGGGGGDTSVSGGGGGSGANGGGIIAIYARAILRGGNSTAGIIAAKGGTGGNGGSPASGNTGGGGGGAGGGGGWIVIFYQTLLGTATSGGTIDCSSGAGGTGGTHQGTGTDGTGGASGRGGRLTLVGVNGYTETNNTSSSNAASGTTGGASFTTTANL